MRLKVSNVCQLLDKSTFQGATRNGITVTNNGDGTFTVNGTTTNDTWLDQPLFQFQTSNPGYHSYLFDIGQYGGSGKAQVLIYFYDDVTSSPVAIFGLGGTPQDIAAIKKLNGSISGRGAIIQARLSIVVLNGTTVTNWTIRPQLFDLTEMYGAGNEPTTVAQFRQDFPNEMYDYSPVCWKKFRRLKYVTETKNLLNISDKTHTVNGVTITISGNLITLNGTATKYTEIPCTITSVATTETCVLSFEYRGGNISNYTSVLTLYNHIYDKEIRYPTTSITGVVPTTATNALSVRFSNGVTFNNFSYYLQIELGSTVTPYQPYGYLPLNRGKYIANKEPVQLLDKSKFKATSTDHGVTFTNNEDGTITVNGTNNGEIYYTLEVITSIPVGHKVIIDDSNSTLYFFGDMRDNNSVLLGTIPPRTIFTLPDNLTRLNMLYFVSYSSSGVGHTYNNELSRPQLFDLTEMYGAGNEPTTVAQFRADYPNALYDYNPYNAITFR